MMTTTMDTRIPESAMDTYIRGLIDAAGTQRVPGLFADDRIDAIYRLHNRSGISVIAERTTKLNEECLLQIMSFRFGQYLAAGYLNTGLVHDLSLKYEPLSSVSAGDIHVLAGSAETGEILCYGSIRELAAAPADARMRDSSRPLCRNENVFGRSAFDHLAILTKLAVTGVRELGPFVKNQQKGIHDELALRAPIETFVAGTRTFLGPLQSAIQAIIGGLEEAVVKRNMAYFQWPVVVLRADAFREG